MSEEESPPDLCAEIDDVPFPTSDEAKEILNQAGIDLTNLKAKVKRRLCGIRGHVWKISWPLEPCEYTCEKCGEKTIH